MIAALGLGIAHGAAAGGDSVSSVQACERAQLTSADGCSLAADGIRFLLRATDEGSLNRLSIQVEGLEGGDAGFEEEIDGSAYLAELADLDGNGWPEIYVYIASAGSGSYGSLVAYAVNRGLSATPVYLPPLEQTPEAAQGYMGHDRFAIAENRLMRRFPVYLDGDTNRAPSGGTRQVQYRLEPGEAGWILVVDALLTE